AYIFQCVRKFDSSFVDEPARLVHIEIAGAGGRSEKTFAEARAFFIRPIHHAHGDWRLTIVLSVNAPQNFNSGENIQAAIEPSAVRHGIHVAADEQRLLGFATQREPSVARG